MGHGTVIRHACYRAYHGVQEKRPKKVWVSPNGNGVWVFNGSPAVDEQMPIKSAWKVENGANTQCK